MNHIHHPEECQASFFIDNGVWNQIPSTIRAPLNELISALCHRIRNGARREKRAKARCRLLAKTLKQFGLSAFHLNQNNSGRRCNSRNTLHQRAYRHSQSVDRLIAYHDASLNNVINLSEHWILKELTVNQALRESTLQVLQKDFVRNHDVEVRDYDQDQQLGLQRALQYLAYGLTQRDLKNFRKSV